MFMSTLCFWSPDEGLFVWVEQTLPHRCVCDDMNAFVSFASDDSGILGKSLTRFPIIVK